MTRAWIQDGLKHSTERELAQRHVHDRRHHWHALIETGGPSVMGALVDELAACIDECRRADPACAQAVRFERLPRGGFIVTRDNAPRAILQGRPDYPNHSVHCNWTHAGERDGEMIEVPFNLHFTVDESERVGLRHGSRSFDGVAEVAEFLLKPVLFPGLS